MTRLKAGSLAFGYAVLTTRKANPKRPAAAAALARQTTICRAWTRSHVSIAAWTCPHDLMSGP
jgi:hypothetical protein